MDLTDLFGPIENHDPASTLTRKVILWGQGDLFTQAIEFLLDARKTLKVVRIFAKQGMDFLVEQVNALHPDVVILYFGDRAPDEHLPMRLIQSQPDLKVVMVCLENNNVQVFQKQNLMIREVSDLLSIIES